MSFILYIFYILVTIAIARGLFYLLKAIIQSKKLSNVAGIFLLMLLFFFIWTIFIYLGLLFTSIGFKRLGINLIRSTFVSATLLVVFMTLFSLRIFFILAKKLNQFTTILSILVGVLGLLFLYIILINFSQLVVDANVEQLQFFYGSFYHKWRIGFTLFNIITILVGVIFWLYTRLKNNYYASYRIFYTLLAYIITLVWGTFWNVFLPTKLNTSRFSIFGPLGSLIYFYLSMNILGTGIPNLIEEFEKMKRSSTFWVFIMTLYLVFILIMFNNIDIILKGVSVVFFAIISIFLVTVFSFQQKILGYELYLFDKTVKEKYVEVSIKKVLGRWLSFVRRFFKEVEILALGYPQKDVLLLDLSNSDLSPPILKNYSQRLSDEYGWLEFDDYLVIYDVTKLPVFSIKSENLKENIFYNKIVIFYKLKRNYVKFFYFFKYTRLYLKLLIYFVYILEKSKHFNDLLEEGIFERTKRLATANKRMQAAYNKLKSLYASLKKSDEAKTMFLSIVSHQLRTPLSVMANYVTILEGGTYGPLTPKQKETLDRIKDSAIRLKNLVMDVLQSSRLERGKFSIVLSNVKLADLVKKVFEQLTSMAKKKDHVYRLHIQDKVKDLIIKCDKDKMFEAFTNLIDNAIHYTPNGGQIDVYLYQEDPEWVIFAVKDTGIGIPKEEQHKLFGKFARLENAKEVRPDGTGIGLYLVKQIVDGHKGKVWFESELGKGTTFYVALRTNAQEVEQYVKEQEAKKKAAQKKKQNKLNISLAYDKLHALKNRQT